VPPTGGAVVAAGSGTEDGAGVGSAALGDAGEACAGPPKIASLILLKMLIRRFLLQFDILHQTASESIAFLTKLRKLS
jgi:hypothetical protein